MGYQEEKKWHNEQEDCIVTLHPVPDLESCSNVDQIKIRDHNEEQHIATPPLDNNIKPKMSFITRLKVCFAKLIKMNAWK